MIGTLIGMAVTGLVIGAVARLFLAGDQRLSILWTMVLGAVGALLGGGITSAVLGEGHTIIAFIVSVVVAMIVISLFISATRKR